MYCSFAYAVSFTSILQNPRNLCIGHVPCFQQQRQSSKAVSQRMGSSRTQSTDKLTAGLIQSERLTAVIFTLHFQQRERLSKILQENITEVQEKRDAISGIEKIERVILLYDFRQCIKFNLPPAGFKSNSHPI